MIKQFSAAALGLITLLGMNPARADYLVYTNRAQFQAVISNERIDNFNELGTKLQVFNSTGLSTVNGLSRPLKITSSSNFLLSASSSAIAGYYPNNQTYLLGPISTSPTDGITVSLPSSKFTAAGANVAAFASYSVISMLVTTSQGETFTSSVAVDATSTSAKLGFLGVAITTPNDYVTSLTFSAPVGNSENVIIDNFSYGFGPLAVPEPASMALIVTGALAIGATALRRRLRAKNV